MYWLTFDTSGDIQVHIAQANHLMLARIKAGMAGQKGEFQEGHRLDAKDSARKWMDVNCDLLTGQFQDQRTGGESDHEDIRDDRSGETISYQLKLLA
jgi:hypothetical protein